MREKYLKPRYILFLKLVYNLEQELEYIFSLERRYKPRQEHHDKLLYVYCNTSAWERVRKLVQKHPGK